MNPRTRLKALLTVPAPEPGGLVEHAPVVGVREVFRRFWPYARPYRRWWALVVLLVLIAPLLDTATIWMFKILVDDVLVPRDFALFFALGGAYLGITVLAGIIGFADEYVSTWVAERFLLDLRTDLFGHLHELSIGFLDRRKVGDTLSRLTGDVGAIEQLVLSGTTQALAYLFKIVLFAGAMFVLSWRLALVSLVAVPAFWLAARYFSRRIKAASREKRRRSGAIGAVAEESLSNAALVKAYGRERAETQRFHRENLGSFAAEMVATRLHALFSPLVDLLELGGVLLIIGFGTWELTRGTITLGGLLVFLGYLSQLYSPVRGFGRLTNRIYAASAGAERIIELLDQVPEVRDPAHPRRLGRARGEVVFDAVSFRYPNTGRDAVHRIGFEVRPGQAVALVGASGSGKSTVGKLLLRFYDPDSGAVALDGVDLRAACQQEVRHNISVVLQDVLAVDASVRDNIAWGRPGATDREVVRAARAADAHEFITALPDGYRTAVGAHGSLLSGGQRQRIAIARAMLRDAPVLLLDEPTAGLDAASTARVLEPLRRLMADRTSIVIAHNLMTVRDADRILLLDDGRIAESGTHAQLMRRDGRYASMYRLQQVREPV
ncbi:ATP-binding cassette, subfamily B/ATP-binding cassette, subfamily B, MsbA [Saccharopolyspora antimicrobica]|uniref:ATP-binding cassette subfamily B protein n=1 Tax=Saccharopolyspora antimicrobica TaxID=455193 RepID=A0A1I5FP43_9PSEU|nr:ABC transporter ATP-binding protein [Saccharopolyspora antimicrobica]RKT82252.1 ATP-binding cassette subfamily B protein [Saccharopolyspora antimicrobica]SFO25534.1 ATP-binding cassette, subfamily B/ATP-binding cassette, subfamily B, MsbA [Saccharopolyspora antimicrobica]